jgi:hypothetical protein
MIIIKEKKMATFNLNLTTDYCSEWDFWCAVRELFQNGDDQERKEPSNVFTIEYNEKQKKLIISNKESILERNTILMGKTTKADDPDSTGKYGEGYKVALAVLTRLGKKVVINNFKKNEKWTPISIADKAYDGEKVIKLKIEKYIWTKTPDNNLTWTIHNVTKDEWDSIQPKYLKFNTIKNSYSNDNNTVIFDKKFKGCIFVNGLFVEKVKTKLEFGYNFHPSTMPLDRDRKTVEGFKLDLSTSNLLESYASESKENALLVKNLIKSESPDVKFVQAEYMYGTSPIFEEFQESFLEDNGSDAFPVSSQEEFDHIKEISKKIKPIIVSNKEKEFIAKNSNYSCVETFAKKYETNGVNQTLTPEQILKTFLIKHKTNMNYKSIKDLQKIIDASEKWMIIPDERDGIHLDDFESKIHSDETPDDTKLIPVLDGDDDGFKDIPF